MYHFIKPKTAVAHYSGATFSSAKPMESRDHFKNGKNQMNSIKKIAFLFIACIAMCVNVSAQSGLTYSFGGGIKQDGKILKPKQVKEIMSVNSEALQTFKTGNTITSVGVGMIGVGVVLVLGDSDTVILGAASFGVGLITGIIGESLRKKSVTLYNSKLSANSIPYNINFGFTQTGVGLSMHF